MKNSKANSEECLTDLDVQVLLSTSEIINNPFDYLR